MPRVANRFMHGGGGGCEKRTAQAGQNGKTNQSAL